MQQSVTSIYQSVTADFLAICLALLAARKKHKKTTSKAKQIAAKEKNETNKRYRKFLR